MKLKYIKPLLLSFCLAAFSVPAATANCDSHAETNLLIQLLNEPAPPPNWWDLSKERLFPVFDGSTDSLLTLLNRFKLSAKDYEENPWNSDQFEKPSENVQQQLIDGCIKHPEFLPDLLTFLPETPETYDAVYACFQNGLEKGLFDDGAQLKVKDWLMIRSHYFRKELIEQAKSISRGKSGFLQKEEYLEYLAALDWEMAEEILIEFTSNDIPHISTYALCLRYKHTTNKNEADSLRTQLIKIVDDPAAPASTRDMACDTILHSDWIKKDEWFLELVQTLSTKLIEGRIFYQPLVSYTESDPDKYIPMVCQFVGSTNRVAHNNAVQCLVRFHLEKTRVDALKPLLPWLDNPEWADGSGRLRLIQSMDLVQLPECAPGLLWVVQHGRDYEINGAADALVHYHATNAVPDLKKSLQRENGYTDQTKVISAIHQLGGFSEAEIAEAVVTYFTDEVVSKQRTLNEQSAHSPKEQPESVTVSIGRQLCTYALDPEDLTDQLNEYLLNRINEIEKTNPTLSIAIKAKLKSWLSEKDCSAPLKEIERNGGSTDLWVTTLENRDELLDQCKGLLEEYSTGNDRLSVLATIILGSPVEINRILEKGNCDECITLLACSRLIREELPTNVVMNLYGTGCSLLDLAVQRYLTEYDSEESRAALQQLDPQKKLHTGYSRFSSPDSTDNFPAGLINLFEQERPPDEVFALIHGYEGSADDILITVYSNSTKLIISQRNERYQTRDLPLEDIARLMRFVSQNQFDVLPPLHSGVCGGVDYNYYHITPDGGRRVYINNPWSLLSEAPVYYALVDLFKSFCAQDKLTLHYSIENVINDFEILINGHESRIRTVCIQDENVHVFAGDYEEERWHLLEDNSLARATEQPAICPITDAYDDSPEDSRYSDYLNPYPWKSGHDDWVIRTAEDNDRKNALWLCKKGAVPKKLIDGTFSNPMVSSDGRWVVAAKSIKGWAYPSTVIRYDLINDKEFVLDLPPVGYYEPVAFISQHQKFLICHDDNFFLLNPVTGKTEPIDGEFDPITLDTDEMFRPLQNSSEPDCYWVAMEAGEKGGTNIGYYNMRSFTFEPILHVPELWFNSMDMWIDETNRKVYLAINGDLLRFSLINNISSDELE